MALQPVRRNRLEHLRTEAVGRRWPRTHTFSATGAPVQGGQPEALHLASGAHEGCLRAVSTALRRLLSLLPSSQHLSQYILSLS